MTPSIVYNAEFLMNDGTKPDLTLGKSYEIISAFDCDNSPNINIIDDVGTVHTFDLNCKEMNFHKYFEIEGDYTEVWEATNDQED